MAGPGESSSTDAAFLLTINTDLPSRRNTFTNWADSSEDESIYTPTTSEDTSSDERMDTPTTPTPVHFVTNFNITQDAIRNNTVPAFSNPDLSEQPKEKYAAPIANNEEGPEFSMNPFESTGALLFASSRSGSFNTAEFWDPAPRATATAGLIDEESTAGLTDEEATAGLTDAEATEFYQQAMDEAIKNSTAEIMTRAERAAINRAITESQGTKVEYSPANREQQRIMIAFVEDLTMEKGYHTKEDDKFFTEILEQDEEEVDFETDFETDSDDTMEGHIEDDSDDTMQGEHDGN